MPTKRMLIDASHPEETRVVVINGQKLDDFDVEVQSRKQLKGNIYLAKITRVEPSLQAAFVNYGGNRHGFLAFNEIHPDYYQIPVADKEALLANERLSENNLNEFENTSEEDALETLGGDISEEVERRRPRPQQKSYKIQEVIKRNQVLLIQIVKEERGTKGAALSTYLSLAGRYCVLMPNTARGGGISRKINKVADRKRLKSIISDLGIPDSMAVIIRTAGSKRSKVEIKRDYEYTTRIWSSVRELTLESIAPALVHEEGNLIKRSIRDLYDKDLEEVIVAGDSGYRMAKNFMKLLIPSHTKKVQPYSDSSIPLMQQYQVEAQLDAIHLPEVFLKSGGYIVINPTEALVSIDVNSGKATKERNIEETALKTNLEAAVEIACQLRLRDLSGLIVIDFIDMEFSRNQQKVEKQIKDAMQNDRARIQIGKISPFGLLELSRQRLRPSLIENSSEPCPHCNGSGLVRSIESTAVHILRVIEEECSQANKATQTIFVPTAIAIYLLNNKRQVLADIERRYQTSVYIQNDDSLIPPNHHFEESQQHESPKSEKHDLEQLAVKDNIKRKRRRRSRRNSASDAEKDSSATSDLEVGAPNQEINFNSNDIKANVVTSDANNEDTPKRRRRGRRGGRRKVPNIDATPTEQINSDSLIGQPPPNNDKKIENESQKSSPDKEGRAIEDMKVEQKNAQSNKLENTPNGEHGVDKGSKPRRRRSRALRKEKDELPREKTTEKIKDDGSNKNKIAAKTKAPTHNGARKSNKKKEVASKASTHVDDKEQAPKKIPTKKNKQSTDKTTIINVENSELSESPTRSGWWKR